LPENSKNWGEVEGTRGWGRGVVGRLVAEPENEQKGEKQAQRGGAENLKQKTGDQKEVKGGKKGKKRGQWCVSRPE